jgi:hypothetical protein
VINTHGKSSIDHRACARDDVDANCKSVQRERESGKDRERKREKERGKGERERD